jgi:uncharacterized integral membrane protein
VRVPVTAARRPKHVGSGLAPSPRLQGVGLLLIFMLQNTESVRLDFLFWGFTWPLWASAFLGALVWFRAGCHAPSTAAVRSAVRIDGADIRRRSSARHQMARRERQTSSRAVHAVTEQPARAGT